MKVLLCPLSDPGYLYPTIAVGIELKRRGHQVFLVGRKSVTEAADMAGITLVPVEGDDGTGALSVRFWFRNQFEQYREVLNAGRAIQPDVVITSVLCHGGLLAAEKLDVPAVVLGLTAHLWPYSSGAEGEREMPARRDWRLRETVRYYRDIRAEVGLPIRSEKSSERELLGSCFLLRGDPALEYPGAKLPEGIYHVGPCLWEPDPDPADLEQITEFQNGRQKQLVYVHLGRSFQGIELWPQLNAAFTNSSFQAIVEQGRSESPKPDPNADIMLVRLPWMAPLISRAGLVISSATSAPVLGSLVQGRPLLVAPAGSEQPLLAEACVRAGVARRLPLEATPQLPEVIASAFHDMRLHQAAQELAVRLRKAGGARLAADLVEGAAGRPTLPGSRSVAVDHELSELSAAGPHNLRLPGL